MKPLAALALAAALAGCGTPAPAPVWHSLVTPAAPATGAAAPAPAADGLRIAVARVTLPDEVDRDELVLRTPGGGIGALAGERWSEPLKSQLPRAIALGLSTRLPGAITSAYPAPAPAAPAGRLTVEVQRFELTQGTQARATLRVLWTWRPADGPAFSRITEVSAPASGPGAPALVAAMGDALGKACDQIAAGLR